MRISSHTIVCNEERYIWYSLMSVASYMDHMFVWDTGSTDLTVEIIREAKKVLGDKLSFKEFGKVDPTQFSDLREKMLKETSSDWFLVLDGDEVWWESSIRKVVRAINKDGNKLDSIVVPYYNLVGDIYHYQDNSLGKYKIDGNKGFLTIRAINKKIPGLKVVNPHPKEAYVDENNVPIQERSKKARRFLDVKYMHFTHLLRSEDFSRNKQAVSRGYKYKYELGREFSKDFYYPEVFFRPKPEIVKSVWKKMDMSYVLKSSVYFVPRSLKRKLKR